MWSYIFHSKDDLNDVIVDHDVMAAILDHVNDPDLPMEEDFPLFDENQLVIGDMFFDLLGHPDAAAEAA